MKSAVCLGVVLWLIAAREAPTPIPGPRPAQGVAARGVAARGAPAPAQRTAEPDPLAAALQAASSRLGRAAVEHCAANPGRCLEAADALRRARAGSEKAGL